MEINSNSGIPDPATSVKRPQTLSLLCVLTFIGSGVSLFSSLFVAAAYEVIPLVIEEAKMPEAEQMLDLMLVAGRPFFIYMAILYAISLAGAIMMWRLRKTGFHLYTTSQLLMLILPLVVIDNYQLPWTSVLLTVTFILAYGMNLKFMK